VEARVQREGGDRVTQRVVGIDLGTTNTAVAWAEVGERARVRILEVPQLVAPSELGGRPTLPSFVYLTGEHDLPAGATALPWDETRRVVVGELARSQGVRVPGRMVASSKSWLCHPGVDRHASILPWGASDGPKLSPIDAAARVLAHVAEAWDHAMGSPLADADVVLTVPASFDEVARELTADAAQRAGLDHVTLVEEPQAVFYAWIDLHDPGERRRALGPGERVLVCDVGGGTTDFTLIEVSADGNDFSRTAVGDHLLLGGDNIDISLAKMLEPRLGKLDAVQWHGLVHACRLAKEQILSDPSIDRRTITVAARGSKLIGGTLQAHLDRDEVESLVLEGFFPLVEREAQPLRTRGGLHEFGLPYAQDPAITKHLAEFLGRHRIARVDAIVFNGGAMKPPAVRKRVIEQLAAWQGSPPRELENASPELAVARGAAYYGLVRHGFGARIRGGAARAYYIGVHGGAAVCVLPRGAEEGTERELARDFTLVMNRPVSFRLYSASTRADQPGDVIADARATDALAELPPLVTVLRAPGRAEARVRLAARLTEVGTLELWCVEGEQKWRLSFDLRGGRPETSEDSPDPRLADARRALERAFSSGDPNAVMKDLEKILEARRDEWPTATIRALWDALWPLEAVARARSADAEARWLNLAGFFLRPGIGAPLDEWRAREVWKIFQVGLKHEKEESCRLAWWILWRRIGAGLKRTHQEQIYDRLVPLFVPNAQQKARWQKLKPSAQEAMELLRALASMERLSAVAKTKLGDGIVEGLEKIAAGDRKALFGLDADLAFWAVGRIGARAPLYGPADAVVPPDAAGRWLERLLALPWRAPEKVAFSVAQLARRTGDRARDLPEDLRAGAAERLRATPGGERTARLVEEIVELEAREERVAFGDSLPTGLRLADYGSETG
jgi:molecular chaperone DnaK (HSP70)